MGLVEKTFARIIVFLTSAESFVHSKTIVKGCELCAVNVQVAGVGGVGAGAGTGASAEKRDCGYISKG